tara:strand:+ start:297 stop:590 length:294 start_codon:yes stop_codon:yes gene_type:complete
MTNSEGEKNSPSRNQGTDVKPEVEVTSSNEDTYSKGLSDDQNQKSYIRVQNKEDGESSFMLNRDLKPRLQQTTNDHVKSWDFSGNPSLTLIYKKIGF